MELSHILIVGIHLINKNKQTFVKKKKKHRGWIYLISLPFCKILQLSIQLKKEILSILSKLLPLKMFKAHSNSNYIVDDLNMGHPTQQIKTLMQSSFGGNKNSLYKYFN